MINIISRKTGLSGIKEIQNTICYAYSLSHVRCFSILWTVAGQAPLSMGILQARILEWVALLSSKGSSQPREQAKVSCIAGRHGNTQKITFLLTF